jgi:hypothetical protein
MSSVRFIELMFLCFHFLICQMEKKYLPHNSCENEISMHRKHSDLAAIIIILLLVGLLFIDHTLSLNINTCGTQIIFPSQVFKFFNVTNK